jgi:para-nitrobenzyl esterase
MTRFGAVRGFEDASDTWVWKAIPFARPPVGELRWRAPRDPVPWKGVRGPRELASPSLQYVPAFPWVIEGSEDCLYLNVWRPRSAETGLPVYVWIHGGGNSMGSAAWLTEYRGSAVADSSRLVYVSVNYRLGPMGWFAHPALREGSSALDDSGNYGTLDLVQALKWVKENIAAFGGDPERVMIAGESAGGFNVLSLLVSPAARGLFSRALVESGGPKSASMADAEGSADRVLRLLLLRDGKARDAEEAGRVAAAMRPVDVRAYLRSKTGREILRCFEPSPLGMFDNPAILRDGAVIPASGYGTLGTAEQASRVPLIIGTNAEESKLFMYFNPALDPTSDLYAAYARYTSMRWKAEGVDGVARALASSPDSPPVYAYLFSWGAPDASGRSPMPGDWGRRLGAFHSLEIPFFHGMDTVFGGLLDRQLLSASARQGRKALSAAMMSYVASFVRTGDPNDSGSGLPRWEPWSNEPGAPRCIVFDADESSARISMTDREVTLAGIQEEMRSRLAGDLYRKTSEYVSLWSLFSR